MEEQRIAFMLYFLERILVYAHAIDNLHDAAMKDSAVLMKSTPLMLPLDIYLCYFFSHVTKATIIICENENGGILTDSSCDIKQEYFNKPKDLPTVVMTSMVLEDSGTRLLIRY
ncbi:hypothetical protein ACJX0J_006241, partial [Zea mays]